MSKVSVSGGVGFGGLLCIVLIVLKVLEKIDMSWFLVLTSWFWAPLLMALVIMTFIGACIGLFWFGALVIDKWRTK